jgi:hypothetical protein
MTSVLIHKPTIINGAWGIAPFILTRTSTGWSDRPLSPNTQKEQANERTSR